MYGNVKSDRDAKNLCALLHVVHPATWSWYVENVWIPSFFYSVTVELKFDVTGFLYCKCENLYTENLVCC